MTMLEYFKMILQKVSFDVTLFRTELEKATHSLLPEDIQELKQWCIEKFGISYCQKAVPGFTG